jgi:hypothetical protein
MDRDIDRDDERPAERELQQEPEPDRPAHTKEDRVRIAVQDRDRSFQISPDERETMRDLGRFRVVALKDLADHRYQGNTQWMKEDLKNLRQQGLLRVRTLWLARGGEKEKFVTLTKQGERLVKKDIGPSGQQVFSGFVKRAEVAHDAAIYRAYQAEAIRIENDGGRVGRIVLDYELKRLVYKPLAKIQPHVSRSEYKKRQAEVAEANGLKVVGGRIRLPDLRIEYETREGERTRVDIEVASASYHGSHAAIKAAAGFRIYGSQDTVSRLSRSLEERDIVADILSL